MFGKIVGALLCFLFGTVLVALGFSERAMQGISEYDQPSLKLVYLVVGMAFIGMGIVLACDKNNPKN